MKFSIDGAPCAVKAACTVRTGGKPGESLFWSHQRVTYRYSFFTDPTISTLTSGTPSQNVDLGGLSFPRRLGVRFNSDFIKHYSLSGMQVKWDAYEDCNFTKKLGKDFEHTDTVSREGWAMYYFGGKFANDTAYLRLRILNPDTGMLMRTFYFMFQKSYQMSLNARYYVTDPVLGDKIVKNGILTELKLMKSKNGMIAYQKDKTTFKQWKIKDVANKGKKEIVHTPAIVRTMVRYSEKPKMVNGLLCDKCVVVSLLSMVKLSCRPWSMSEG